MEEYFAYGFCIFLVLQGGVSVMLLRGTNMIILDEQKGRCHSRLVICIGIISSAYSSKCLTNNVRQENRKRSDGKKTVIAVPTLQP